jgi:hypothetical protein
MCRENAGEELPQEVEERTCRGDRKNGSDAWHNVPRIHRKINAALSSIASPVWSA